MGTQMYQSFETQSRPDQGPHRLGALRQVLDQRGLDGYIIPRTDQFQGEYVAPCDERLAWLTGFTGSAGFCIALRDHAGVFVDGRYRVQVKVQSRPPYTPVDWPETQPGDWMKQHLSSGQIGFDPWLHTVAEIERLTQALNGSAVELVACDNVVDEIWHDRPAAPCGVVRVHPVTFAGKTHDDKRAEIAEILRTAGDAAAILCLPESVSWLLNIRGSDIVHNPVVQSYAIVHDTGSVDLFIDDRKLTEIGDHLGPDVTVHPFDGFLSAIERLTGSVRIDPASLPQIAYDRMRAAGIALRKASDPTILPKACKNDIELASARESHMRDAAHMCEFLFWLDIQTPEETTEIDVAVALENIRRRDPNLLEISFDTISASGPNAALPHYRVSTETNRTLRTGEVMLIDSGGQYLDGTTDITRTVALGPQPAAVKEAFTRVLQGMIAISRLRFPVGIEGQHIDVLARTALWQAGQDYAHGTGHGVGHYLCVHEGPQGIARRYAVPLRPGMIVSNEPGFYQEGAFGIRTENLIIVRQSDDFKGFLEFETLTYVPIDRRMIVVDMLSPDERDWINAYHQTCRDKIGPRLTDATRVWFDQMTEPL